MKLGLLYLYDFSTEISLLKIVYTSSPLRTNN